MFERFTQPARAVVVRAQEEAAARGSERIGADHLLIALAAGEDDAAARMLARHGLTAPALRAELRGDGLDAAALASIGIDLDEVRRRVEETFGPGALARRRRGRRPFTPAAKKTLELALREALVLGDRHIGPEHILLGALRDASDGIDGLLRRLGTTPETVRAALLDALRTAA